jgi:hypothetical protein
MAKCSVNLDTYCYLLEYQCDYALRQSGSLTQGHPIHVILTGLSGTPSVGGVPDCQYVPLVPMPACSDVPGR